MQSVNLSSTFTWLNLPPFTPSRYTDGHGHDLSGKMAKSAMLGSWDKQRKDKRKAETWHA